MTQDLLVRMAAGLMLLGQVGCNSCTSLFSDPPKVESYVGEDTPPFTLDALKALDDAERQNLELTKEEEHMPGFAGGRSPLGVIFLPIILGMYLSLDEWWVAEYSDAGGNRYTLRFREDGDEELLGGEIVRPDGLARHIALLDLEELERRVLVEVSRQQPGEALSVTSIQKQVDLIGAYKAHLAKETREYSRGSAIREMLLTLRSEGLPLLSQLLESGESDEGIARGLDALCKDRPRKESTEFDKQVLDVLRGASLGPQSAAKALSCYTRQDDLEDAKPFFLALAKSICAGDAQELNTLERFSCRDSGEEKAELTISESSLDTVCGESTGATLVKQHLCLPTTHEQRQALLDDPVFVESALDTLDPSERKQWDLMLGVAAKKPKLVFERAAKLHLTDFEPTVAQVGLLVALLMHAEKRRGLLTRDGYLEQAYFVDILLRTNSSVRRGAERARARLARERKTADDESQATIDLLTLLHHPEGSRTVSRSILKAISLSYAKKQKDGLPDPKSSPVEALKRIGMSKEETEAMQAFDLRVDSRESLLYFTLERFGCGRAMILRSIEKKIDMTCPPVE